MSRWMEVEDNLALAYAARARGASRDSIKMRLLAATTSLILNNAVRLWYQEDYKDLSAAAKQCYLNLTRLFCDESATSRGTKSASGRIAPRSPAAKKSRKQ